MNKSVPGKIAFLAVTLIALASIYLNLQLSDELKEERHPIILTHFDRYDLELFNDFADRFQQGKGGYVLLIPPVVDGGYWIHDVHSQGKEIRWTIDNTRDGMTDEVDRGKREYVCHAIERADGGMSYTFALSRCNGYNEGEKIPVISFNKDKL
ncbi:DUF4362 domain-containing protein [Paenibacillus oceani]|uniref:DUF4362 domain-containing protein n=1 Tax=Paenibacillus oceani TaxID=2772510 RepID=A0A927C651_9BACL|nr:DUF4362 domain-containing protein [Paenibacillus oceani]MBD2862079.1 DUF4362 domain-containing protein [Paenibacillus oceani]